MKKLNPFRPWLSANGIGVTKGYQLVNQGKLKTVKIGKNRFVTDQDADEFIASLSSENLEGGA